MGRGYTLLKTTDTVRNAPRASAREGGRPAGRRHSHGDAAPTGLLGVSTIMETPWNNGDCLHIGSPLQSYREFCHSRKQRVFCPLLTILLRA